MSVVSGLFKAVVGLGMIIGVIAVGIVLYLSLSSVLKAPEGEQRTIVNAPVVFTISPGESVTDVAENLEKAGIIDSALLFRIQMRARPEDSLKAGSFQVEPGMSTDDLITLLSTAPLEIGLRFQVIEGMRLEEMAEKLSAEGIIDKDRFLQLTQTPEGATIGGEFVAQSGKPAELGLEGYLFPDTYEIKRSEGDNSEGVIKVMIETMNARITPEMRQTLEERGRSIHQMLTVASIVQREGVVKEELPRIAAVFWNRVDQGMSLGADPTTQYAVAQSPTWWPNLDEIGVDPNSVDHPFNTYRVVGLPPGPICSPSLAAIEAAVNPEETNYLYFVARKNGGGTHVFAETLEEHERNRVIEGNR